MGFSVQERGLATKSEISLVQEQYLIGNWELIKRRRSDP